MITEYFYDRQLRSYLQQFCCIFQGMMVSTGEHPDGVKLIQVPTIIGNRDRVVAGLMNDNTMNKLISLPIMSAHMSGLDLAPELRKGISVVDNRTYMPAGGVLPEDLKVMSRVMPIPYMMQLELGIYSSNTEQLHQILEQILMIFDPCVQIQTSDAIFDWTKITFVELTGISNEENYPIGTDRRIINWTLSFSMPIYITPPANVKKNVVETVVANIGNLAEITINEFDSEGNIQTFSNGPWMTSRIQKKT